MPRIRLSALLIGINVSLLLLAVTGVAFVAVKLLRQLSDEQALARVEQAGAGASNAVSRSGQEVVTAAQLLAERPTLLRLLETGDAESLSTFLAQFQQTSLLDATAVVRGNQVIAQSGPPLAWASTPREPGYFFYDPGDGGVLILGARETIDSLPDASVLTAVLLDETFSRQIGDEIGLPVRILTPNPSPSPDALSVLRAQSLASDRLITSRLDSPERYAAILPLHAPAAGPTLLLETELSADAVTRSLEQLVRTFLFAALAFAALAALVSFLLGGRLSRPLQTLSRAAVRIGQGDLTTPVRLASSTEVGALAETLEDMRRRLLQLTANLRRQQAESNAIVSGISEGVFAVDRERRIQFVNPQAAAMLGVTGSSAIGRFCGDVLRPTGPGGVRPCEEQCPIIHARFQGGARATEHLSLNGGGLRMVVITSAPPPDEPPSAEFRQVQVMRDETEIETSRRLRDAVLANISHEFHTPLSAQLASIELLLDQLPDLRVEQIGELVVSLQRGTLRLTQLIDNLLESVRIEAGEAGIRRKEVSLEDVVEQAVEMTRPLLDQRQQEVVVDLPYPLPTISGDATRLSQVFVNLLANANKFAPPGTAVSVGGEVAEETVTLWVEDQGPGLPQLPGQTLFARFVRGTASGEGDEPEAGGVGLGLWIVKSIVERHGGTVEAAGTRVSVILPRPDENSSR